MISLKIMGFFSAVLLSAVVSKVEMAELLNTAVSAANNDFTKDVYMYLTAKSNDNSIVSPFSLHVVLGLASFGAKEETATSMMKGLRIKHSDTLWKDYKGILDQLSVSPELKIANKIYLAQNFEISPYYKQQAETVFHSELERTEFSKNVDAAKKINEWVEKKTNDKIKNLIDPSTINALTRVVLINAIHFKGQWSQKFDPAKTKDGPFYTDETTSVNVPMMHLTDKFYIYEESGDDGFKMLELPYGKEGDQHFSMHIFLPNKRDGLANLEKKLFDHKDSFAEKFGNIVKSTEKRDVIVTLPRFKIESTWNMVQLCKDLGMDIIFNPAKANFSGISAGNKEHLYVSDVVQKAFIEVNEEGTEAAAATESNLYIKRGEELNDEIDYRSFEANHPFIVMVLDDKHNIILYISKLTNFKPK